MSDKSYPIGYKKPPKTTQFKPGQSGNPKGRPKGTKNLGTDLQEELAEKILVTEGDKQHTLSKQRAMIKTMFAKALKGDMRAADALIKLIIGLEQANAMNGEVESLSPEDQAILDEFAETILSRSNNKVEGEGS